MRLDACGRDPVCRSTSFMTVADCPVPAERCAHGSPLRAGWGRRRHVAEPVKTAGTPISVATAQDSSVTRDVIKLFGRVRRSIWAKSQSATPVSKAQTFQTRRRRPFPVLNVINRSSLNDRKAFNARRRNVVGYL